MSKKRKRRFKLPPSQTIERIPFEANQDMDLMLDLVVANIAARLARRGKNAD